MPRFIATYRWELWLLLWTPLLSIIASVLVFPLLGFLYDEGSLVPRHVVYGQGATTSLVHAGLLLVFYGRVRCLERRFLTLVWGYAIWLAVVGALVLLIAAAFVPNVEGSELLGVSLWTRGRLLAHGIVALLPLFWFARQASRLSLTHAYFLFLVLKAYSLITIFATTLNIRLFDVVPASLLFTMGLASFFGLGFLLTWLLGNFDSRGIVFRWQVVGWLLVAYTVSIVWEPRGFTFVFLMGTLGLAQFLASVIVPFALIYLVRVRRPTPPQQA